MRDVRGAIERGRLHRADDSAVEEVVVEDHFFDGHLRVLLQSLVKNLLEFFLRHEHNLVSLGVALGVFKRVVQPARYSGRFAGA